MPVMPTWDEVRFKIKQLSKERNLWAGMPVPVPDVPMVVEPRYPYQMENWVKKGKDPRKFVNSWHNCEKKIRVYVERMPSGKSKAWFEPDIHMGDALFPTMQIATIAWDIAAECKAMEKLEQMIKPHLFKSYFLTGTFLERSPRSNITYVFRRGRPTIALSFGTGDVRILTCLCLHPIGYHQGTFCGVMVPSDEVLAHLTLMRGDEHAYWKWANHHAPHTPQAGM
jgi:hypothetical protein